MIKSSIKWSKSKSYCIPRKKNQIVTHVPGRFEFRPINFYIFLEILVDTSATKNIWNKRQTCTNLWKTLVVRTFQTNVTSIEYSAAVMFGNSFVKSAELDFLCKVYSTSLMTVSDFFYSLKLPLQRTIRSVLLFTNLQILQITIMIAASFIDVA